MESKTKRGVGRPKKVKPTENPKNETKVVKHKWVQTENPKSESIKDLKGSKPKVITVEPGIYPIKEETEVKSQKPIINKVKGKPWKKTKPVSIPVKESIKTPESIIPKKIPVVKELPIGIPALKIPPIKETLKETPTPRMKKLIKKDIPKVEDKAKEFKKNVKKLENLIGFELNESKSYTIPICFGLIAVVLVIMGSSLVLNGIVLSHLWNWFIVPISSLPKLSVAVATGICLIYNLFSTSRKTKKNFAWRLLGTSFINPLLILAIGYIIHLFT
jgi:hypothetical protein